VAAYQRGGSRIVHWFNSSLVCILISWKIFSPILSLEKAIIKRWFWRSQIRQQFN